MSDKEAKTACRTPAEGRDGVTRIPSWKYDCVRAAILDSIAAAGENGLPFSKLPDAVRDRLTKDETDRLGSLGWHVTTVKLEMEVRGDIARLPGSPQRLIIPGMGS